MISSPSPSAPEGFRARRVRLRRVAARFDCSLATRCYIMGKMATDPAYGAVRDQFRDSKRPLVDIGCGLGLLAHYLRDHDCHFSIHGYDLDERKIRLARTAAKQGDLRDVYFAVGDAADLPPQSANLVLLDVLHYLEIGDQRNLLRILADRARSGSTVLIRAAVGDQSWRCHLNRVGEWWTRLTGWIPSRAPIRFPTAREILAPFEVAGCDCQIRPLWGRTPFNSYLIVAVAGGQAE